MTYEEVVEQIENIRRFGNLTGAEITARVLEALDSPQRGMRIIHIAGTNGKGSVSAFLCAILRAAGKRVGVFTSPHLVDFRERICVDGAMIGKEDTRRIGELLLNKEFGVYPTMFDYCLAMAILYFREQKCDVVILETGLGGRLDSTNAVGVPEVSVITKIGYDHMAILGDTLEQIAGEKAGIIKKGTALVTESQEPAVMDVLKETAERVGVQSFQVAKTEMITDCRYENGKQRFSLRSKACAAGNNTAEYCALTMQLLGVHQYENAAAAILAAEAFLRNDMEAEAIRSSIYRGIAETRWKGRMEILRTEPFLMVDGAHNSNGVEALRSSLKALFPGEKFHFIMGVMADKDYEKMVAELLPLALDFKTAAVENERALQAEKLADCIRAGGVPAECASELQELIAPAVCGDGAKTVAFGSLYFIGELERLFAEQERA